MELIIFLLVKILDKITSYIKYPLKLHIKLNNLIHKFVFFLLIPYLKKAENIVKKQKIDMNQSNSGIIWIFWWQGYSKMPIIVKCCIKSIIKHANGHKVILISKNNIYHYIQIPNYIYKKLMKGYITYAHFSDILRFALLNKYGGLWIDSTIYCVRDLSSDYFGKFYTSGSGGKNINKYHDFISDKWTGFLIGGYRHNPIFTFMDVFFKLYWNNNNHIIDYFLIDYGLYYIYLRDIGGFKEYVNKIAYRHNPCLHKLLGNLNNNFNVNYYNYIIKNTDMFKLTYKMKFYNNKESYYYKIISNEKNEGKH